MLRDTDAARKWLLELGAWGCCSALLAVSLPPGALRRSAGVIARSGASVRGPLSRNDGALESASWMLTWLRLPELLTRAKGLFRVCTAE